jgi:hypothetical protein
MRRRHGLMLRRMRLEHGRISSVLEASSKMLRRNGLLARRLTRLADRLSWIDRRTPMTLEGTSEMLA